ncbi:hypothetical protein BLA50215_02788 [Burkholderia lata]|uniref:hypothetical protein n=1 Tax=Burkholderia lata (strain ATCC 17760 / DSM 23089 / LMG 22485 / NCIMB 9086 / R18194 / 383) TaxID=482957 RepID=UPI001453DE6E|nr:hypothetical protein [Burkholderia lata]VWD04260.1 hypothetical protein BLA50215_02788 [Burkholderia lata]
MPQVFFSLFRANLTPLSLPSLIVNGAIVIAGIGWQMKSRLPKTGVQDFLFGAVCVAIQASLVLFFDSTSVIYKIDLRMGAKR